MRKFLVFFLFGLLAVTVQGGLLQAQEKMLTNDIGMAFTLLPEGSFMMGSGPNAAGADNDERPQHQVTISRPFYLGKHEVTQEQWEAVMGNNPSKFQGWNNPVEQVSWDEVQVFIERLNAKESGGKYRLPTEAEWEYAARAGTETVYFFGNDVGALGQYAWYGDNAGDKTHPVGQKQPNPWGLYDIYGNVLEWVGDWYGEEYYAGSPATDPRGPSIGSYRVVRGGSWGLSARYCRSAFRNNNTPDLRYRFLGFRLAFSPGQ